jgi:hypothetical protein
MCYSNSTIVNIYWHCRKLVYKIIVNRGGYKITYFVASYRVYSPPLSLSIYIYSNYYPIVGYKITYSVATLSYDNCYTNLRDYSNSLLCNYYNIMVNIPTCYGNLTIVNMYWHYRKLVYKIIVNGGGYRITYFVASYWICSPYIYIYEKVQATNNTHTQSLNTYISSTLLL